jgi:Phage major capsid protein E
VAAYVYPVGIELQAIEAELAARLAEGRVGLELFPPRSVNSHLVRWEQRDNYQGLQQVRGLNGEPPKVKRVGHKAYQMAPGVYGEFVEIDELELTTRREMGSFNTPIDISDLVAEAEEQLLVRELDRLEWIVWTLLTTGTFAVANVHGAVTHTDSYTTQTFTASVPWATSATATPLADFRAVGLKGRGKGVSFGAQAKAYMNRSTLNLMLSNTNNNDLAGRRVSGLLSVLNLNEVNAILMGEDLPQVVPYDEGYLDETATFQLFIPNNKVVVVGQRPAGQTVGEYQFTRNVNNDGMAPGPYTMVEDTLDANRPPRKLTVHRGHNGGIALFFASAIVLMNV